MLWRLLDPRRGWIALAFFRNKVLLVLPIFYARALISSRCCAESGLRSAFFMQKGFYTLSLQARFGRTSKSPRSVRIAQMFTGMKRRIIRRILAVVKRRAAGSWEQQPDRFHIAGGITRARKTAWHLIVE